MPFPFKDLRDFIADAQEHGELEVIRGANTEVEIGALTELLAKAPDPPVTLFDDIEGHEAGYRVVSNLFNTTRRCAAVLGLPEHLKGIELVRAWKERIKGIRPIAPREVSEGPILENVMKEGSIDLYRFPAVKWHQLDGGRYIGSGCSVVTRDPDEGWVNVGTYRCMLIAKDKLTILIAAGKHGDMIRRKYWERGRSCPLVITLGQEPTFFIVGGYQLTPWGVSPFDYAGGLRGEAIEYIVGEATGLPIPATAEVALEGEMPPPSEESHEEGPHGEWPGYYTPAKRVPVVRVKRIYYRHEPIIQGNPPLKPPLPEALGVNVVSAAAIWEEVEKQVPEVKGVWCANEGGTGGVAGFIVVISIRQRYPGHAKQALMAVSSCHAGAYAGRYVIVVDDDIDPSNMSEVLWAVATRCDPARGIDIVKECWDSPTDPLLSDEQRKVGDITTSRALINACRPYHRSKDFPPVIQYSDDVVEAVKKRFSDVVRRRLGQ